MEEAVNTDSKQYVVFRIGREEYGLDSLTAKEIQEMLPITRVPKTPDYIKGVVNLRGEIIPVISLRKKFNLPEVELTEDTRIIIVRLNDTSVGIIVDAVVEVIQIDDDLTENITDFSSDLSMDYVIGVGKIDGRIITLLNFENLIKIA